MKLLILVQSSLTSSTDNSHLYNLHDFKTLPEYHFLITFFSTECKEQTARFVFEEPASLLSTKILDQRFTKRIAEADATLLITDKAATDCPACVCKVTNLDKSVYVWNSCGINCILLGGSIHSRQAAMQLHAILEERNYYPYMANVLPRQCSWHNMYRVDQSMETAGPCVL